MRQSDSPRTGLIRLKGLIKVITTTDLPRPSSRALIRVMPNPAASAERPDRQDAILICFSHPREQRQAEAGVGIALSHRKVARLESQSPVMGCSGISSNAIARQSAQPACPQTTRGAVAVASGMVITANDRASAVGRLRQETQGPSLHQLAIAGHQRLAPIHDLAEPLQLAETERPANP